MSSHVPSIALAAYVEPFIAGRRIVVFGDASAPLAQHLLDRGARFVQVYDRDATRAAAATKDNDSRSLSFTALTQAGASGRSSPHDFDFGIVENLSSYDNPADLVERLQQTLSGRGSALVGVPSPNAALRPALTGTSEPARSPLGYYELYDQVAEKFSDVRMLGQLPFVGYAIADFSADQEADISVDTAFVPAGAEEPSWFWALCSSEPLVGEAFSIVQLPLTQGPVVAASVPTPSGESEIPSAGHEALGARVHALEAELAQRESWITQLEARATAADARADGAENELEQLRRERSSLQSEHEASAALVAENERLRASLARAEATTSVVDGDAASDVANDVARLEAALRERGELVAQLEARLLEGERVVGDLVRELDALRQRQTATPTSAQTLAELAELKGKLDNLALANAERAALLAGAENAIRELEHRLAEATPATPPRSQPGVESAASDVARQEPLLAPEPAPGNPTPG